jgi:hypothetical protein
MSVRTWLVTFGILAAAAGTAAAGGSGTNSVSCGWSSSGWNVPNGSVVFSRGAGPVKSTLDAVGEYRTHSMMSHGPGGWVSHASMYSPGTTGWPTYCSTPLVASDLQNGFPGASQVDQGAIYTYLLGPGSSNEFLKSQRGSGDKGTAVANWMWNSMPYEARARDGHTFYRLKWDATTATNYSLYQYRDSQGVSDGYAGWNSGIVCSTLLAYAQTKSGQGTMTKAAYSHAAVSNALNGLRSGVENDCNNSLGFWSGIGSSVTCFEGICDDAGRQVANCMAVGRCDTDTDGSNSYQSVINDAASTAASISPDRVGCWGPNAGSCTGAGSSVWGWDGSQAVQWNSGGNVYGCWY